MCYSLSLYSDIHTLIRRFNAQPAKNLSLGNRYYISAFTFPEVPVITNQAPGLIQPLRWGLVPGWVKDGAKAREISQKTLNARFETLRQRVSFKKALTERRCLVLVDGFFEFREVGGRKYPYFICMKSGEPFALAGLWGAWKNPGTGQEERTFTIVTIPANPLLASIHNTKKRMPLILTPDIEREWLARPLEEKEIRKVTGRLDDKVLHAYPVSRAIASRNVDGSRMELLDSHDYPELEEEGQ